MYIVGTGLCPSLGINTPVWIKVAGDASYTLFAAGSSTVNIPLFALYPGGVVHGIKIKHKTSFSGGSISAYTISVGTSGNNAEYASAFDVFQAPGSRVYQLSQNFGGEDQLSPTQITVTATCTGDILANATAGAVDIWAFLSVGS